MPGGTTAPEKNRGGQDRGPRQGAVMPARTAPHPPCGRHDNPSSTVAAAAVAAATVTVSGQLAGQRKPVFMPGRPSSADPQLTPSCCL